MPPSNLQAALEALLFSSDQPLPLALLAESLDTGVEPVANALKELEVMAQVASDLPVSSDQPHEIEPL